MTTRRHHHDHPRSGGRPGDRGNTVIEIVMTIAILGIITSVVFGGIGVIFASKDGVSTRVAEAHDLQQLISYLPSDVQAGPLEVAAYSTSTSGASGSGCSPDGSDNVLRIVDGESSTAYTVIDEGTGVARLDRYRCSGGAVVDVVNIADRLVVSAETEPASAEVVLKADTTGVPEVDHVILSLNQTTGDSQVSASPRSEPMLAAPVTGGDCSNDPMEETLGFATFVRSDVHLTNNPQIKWASGIGGSLSFANSASIGQNINSDAELPTVTPFGTALYIGRVDWARSSGTLTMHSNRDVVIDDRSNTTIAANGKSAWWLTGNSSDPKISANGQSDILPIDEEIDFENAFATLRACSLAMAQLPNAGCAGCAVHLEILDQNGSGPYPGVASGTNMKLQLTPGKANVLNISAADFAAMGNMSFVSSQPDQNTPLIVNIMDSGRVVLPRFPNQGGIGNWVKSTIWNFPNATEVVMQSGNDGVWGTVFAPQAHVVSSVKIEGGVVAASWDHDAREVNGPRVFTGSIAWDT